MEFFEQLLHNLPLHPMLVHFPVAIFVSALGLELLARIVKNEQLHQSALLIYILGVAAMPLTAWAGLQEAAELHLRHPVLDIHKRFALLALWTSLASLPVLWFTHRQSQKLFRTVFLAILIFVVTEISIAAYNGGRMVYEYGVGVEK